MSFRKEYELINKVKAGVTKEFTLNKYRITDRMYNRVIDSKLEVVERHSHVYRFNHGLAICHNKQPCNYGLLHRSGHSYHSTPPALSEAVFSIEILQIEATRQPETCPLGRELVGLFVSL